jgi:superfamily II DNA helicase RecQ
VKQKTGEREQPSKNVQHPELYDALRKWKNDLAGELNIPAYMVLPQKSILELVHKLPITLAALKAIKGLGQTKINRFGEDIIAIIENFCHDHDIIPGQVEIHITAKKRKRR